MFLQNESLTTSLSLQKEVKSAIVSLTHKTNSKIDFTIFFPNFSKKQDALAKNDSQKNTHVKPMWTHIMTLYVCYSAYIRSFSFSFSFEAGCS